MRLFLHVDEVDDDDATQVAQPDLARHRCGGFDIGPVDRVFKIAVPGEAAGIDVDCRHGFQLVDHQVPTRAQRHLPVQRARDLLFDLVHGEQRPWIAVVLGLAGIGRHEGAQEFADAGKFGFVIDDHPADTMGAFVAQYPHT